MKQAKKTAASPKKEAPLSLLAPEAPDDLHAFFYPNIIESTAKERLALFLHQKAELPKRKRPLLSLLVGLLFYLEEEGSTCLELSRDVLEDLKTRLLEACREAQADTFASGQGQSGAGKSSHRTKTTKKIEDLLDACMGQLLELPERPDDLNAKARILRSLVIPSEKELEGEDPKMALDAFLAKADAPLILLAASADNRKKSQGRAAQKKAAKKQTAKNKNAYIYFQRHFVRQASVDFKLQLYFNEDSENSALFSASGGSAKKKQTPPSIVLTDEQQAAVEASKRHSLFVLSGGPGTGKTTVIKEILRAHLQDGYEPSEIALAAPTGRAAKRIQETIQKKAKPPETPPDITKEASKKDSKDTEVNREEKLNEIPAVTLHRLLGLHPLRSSTPRPLNYRLIIADEGSMMGLDLFYELLRRLDPSRTKLVLVGDPYQLPSVDPGDVFRDLIERISIWEGFQDRRPKQTRSRKEASARASNEDEKSRLVRLSKSHRSEAGILTIADAIREGQSPKLPRTSSIEEFRKTLSKTQNTLFFTTPDEKASYQDSLKKCLNAWFDSTLGPSYLSAVRGWLRSPPSLSSLKEEDAAEMTEILAASRILAFTRASVGYLNRRGKDWLLRHIPGLPVFSSGIATGSPILIRANEPDLGLYNGDTGLLLVLRDGTPVALFERDEHLVPIRYEDLPEHEAAFAHTVHKSQGSEYESILLVLPFLEDPGRHPLLSRQILYTGFTRAKERALLFGQKDMLRAGIELEKRRSTGPLLMPLS